MKKVLYLLSGVMLLAATACSDDDEFRADVNYPPETVGNQLTTDAWRSTYQLEVKADGSWRIETDDYFLTVSPESGTGDATVTLSLDDNQGERRKVGKLNFIFEGHEEQNCELRVMQKYAGDYDDNAAGKLDTSNKIYAVGYSYDATGYWASPNSVRKQIFCTQNLIDDKLLVIGPVQISTSIEMLSGSIITDMTNQLATKAHVEGGFGKFKAEANASFDMSHAANSNYEFASTYYILEVRKAYIETDYKSLMRSKRYLSTDAYYAINGVPYVNEWTGVACADYPSTTEGFKRLIKEYGTHVIVSAKLGGRVRHSMEVDVSKVKTDYDIKAFAQASCDGLFAGGGASVDERYKKSYEQNRNNLNIKVDALGGDEDAAKKLMATDGLKKDNLDAWASTVTDKNMALVTFDQYSLVPIYELVNEDLTMERNGVDGKERKQKLKDYIEQTMGKEPEFSSYNCGTIVKINLTDYLSPTSSDCSGNKPSLIYTVKNGDQEVAYICNEYIPLLDRTNRVTVVYPIVNDHVFFNKGLFVGDSNHKPATVEWTGPDVVITELESENVGPSGFAFIRGTSITPDSDESVYTKSGVTVQASTTEQTMMTDNDGNKYGLVKILDHIWLREDYRGKELVSVVSDDGTTYYHVRAMYEISEIIGPKGWRAPTTNDYHDIEKKMSEWNVEAPGKLFWKGGALGYDAHVEGLIYRYHWHPTKDEITHLYKWGFFRVNKTGSYTMHDFSDMRYVDYQLHTRLIKE